MSIMVRGVRKIGSIGEVWESWGRDGVVNISSRVGKRDGSSGVVVSWFCDIRFCCECRGNIGIVSFV